MGEISHKLNFLESGTKKPPKLTQIENLEHVLLTVCNLLLKLMGFLI